MSRSGADIRTSGNSRIIVEWISALENVAERSGYFYCVTERGGAGIRLWEKSRIVTERISAATSVTERRGLIEPLRKNRSAVIFSLRTHVYGVRIETWSCLSATEQ